MIFVFCVYFALCALSLYGMCYSGSIFHKTLLAIEGRTTELQGTARHTLIFCAVASGLFCFIQGVMFVLCIMHLVWLW